MSRWQQIVFAATWLPIAAVITGVLVAGIVTATHHIEGWRDRRKAQRGKA